MLLATCTDCSIFRLCIAVSATNQPATVDVVDSVDDGCNILLVHLLAVGVCEEVFMRFSCWAPGDKLVHAACAVPVVGQGQNHLQRQQACGHLPHAGRTFCHFLC